MTKPNRSTAMTLNDVFRSAAGALVPKADPQPGPPTEPAGSPATAPTAPASEPIATQPDPNPTAPTPPPLAAPTTPEETTMTTNLAPAAPTAPPVLVPAPPPPRARPRKWVYNPSSGYLALYELTDIRAETGEPYSRAMEIAQSMVKGLIEVDEQTAKRVLAGERLEVVSVGNDAGTGIVRFVPN